MWSYYGSKANIIDRYPKPKYNKVNEPFCGSARYALKYWENDVKIMDKYPVVINIWKYLQECSPADILGLPRLRAGDELKNIKFDCEEQRDLMGFLIGFGGIRPRNKVSPRLTIRPNHINFALNRIAEDLHKIKHWEVQLGSYEDFTNEPATWFIDPPYQVGGASYKFSSREIDFCTLGQWCREREGQVMVCEGAGAEWLPFKPLVTQKTKNGMYTDYLWTNDEERQFEQASLF